LTNTSNLPSFQNQEEWLKSWFKPNLNDSKQIEFLDDLINNSTKPDFNNLKKEIINACYQAYQYKYTHDNNQKTGHSSDGYKILQASVKNNKKLATLLNKLQESLNKNNYSQYVMRTIFADSLIYNLPKDGFHITDNSFEYFYQISPLLKQTLPTFTEETAITEESFAPSGESIKTNNLMNIFLESLNSSLQMDIPQNGKCCLGNLCYPNGIPTNNRQPNIAKIGLIYQLVLIIEKWEEYNENKEKNFIITRNDQLNRQTEHKKTFQNYQLVTDFVNATFNENSEVSNISNLLSKFLKRNSDVSYVPFAISDKPERI